MKSRWVEHKGKRVFIADFSNLEMDHVALRLEADAVVTTLEQEPPDSVIAITDVTETAGVAEIVAILKDTLAHTNQYVHKRCVVGIEGLRWYIVRLFNQITGAARFVVFSTLEEALDWIVQD